MYGNGARHFLGVLKKITGFLKKTSFLLRKRFRKMAFRKDFQKTPKDSECIIPISQIQ